ncbi:hypothetical protein AR325_26980 (plasmid) [Serratia marcescens]|nr:hypothetical protein AR325_26980 [Serratia marcescens]
MNTRSKHNILPSLHREILISLFRISPSIEEGGDESKWATTRQIADMHDLNIYKARRLLRELVEFERVIVSETSINNSLRWYPNDGSR